MWNKITLMSAFNFKGKINHFSSKMIPSKAQHYIPFKNFTELSLILCSFFKIKTLLKCRVKI